MISDSSIKWIENLAEQEGLISSGQLSSLDLSRTRDEILRVSTVVFLRELKSQSVSLSKLFNSYMKEPRFGILWGEIPDREDCFYLERNSVRLNISFSRPGLIQVTCEKKTENLRISPIFSGVLEARFSSFDEVAWYFLEKAISGEQITRYYLTEFLQSSRNVDNLV